MQRKELIVSISKRFLLSILVVFIIISFIFVLIRLAPGDPSHKFISTELSPKHIELVQQNFQLDKPIYVQYLIFIKNFFQGDLGISYHHNRPVVDVILDYLPFTIIFSLIVFSFQLIISFILAFVSMKYAGRLIDKLITKLSLVVYSLPVFVTALLLIFVFSVMLGLLPVSSLSPIQSTDRLFFFRLVDYVKHLILPVTALSLVFVPVYFRYMRDNFESLTNSAFVMNLRANGISDRVILLKHIIPNSIGPLLAIAGIDIGALLSGSLITEYIFNLPGMGRLTIESILARDYPMIIGCSILASLFMVIGNIGADIFRTLLDKRNSKIIIS